MTDPSERHQQIVSAINSVALEDMGVGTADLSTLDGVSLLEMIEASRALENDNKAQPKDNGTRSFWIIPDDRLVAAVYAWMHYAAPAYHRPFEEDTAVVVVRVAGHAHALVVCSRPVRAEAEEAAA
jgi:hypothetical protein